MLGLQDSNHDAIFFLCVGARLLLDELDERTIINTMG